MAANKLPETWPSFNLKVFESLKDSYTKVRDFIRALEDFRKRLTIVTNDHATRLTPTTGSGAPSSTPTDVLLFYLDTTNEDMYVSVGTVDSADWKKITP